MFDPLNCLEEGMGAHLLKHHLSHEAKLETNICTFCCSTFNHQDSLVEHIIHEHMKDVTRCLVTIFGLPDEEFNQVKYSDFFIGYDNPDYVDFISINIDKLVEVEEQEPQKKRGTAIESLVTTQKRPAPTEPKVEASKVMSKKLKTEEKPAVPKSVSCDVCQFHVRRESISKHMTKHFQQELFDLIGSRDTCINCNKVVY